MLLVLIVLGLFFLLIFGFFVYLFDSFYGGLDLTTGQPVVQQVIKIIKERHLENGNFYDLGSCRGHFALRIAKGLPRLKVLGIDDSRFRTLLAKARGLFLKNLTFKKDNIFNTNLSDANIIYLYLPQELMQELEIKLQKELKPGSLAISASVSFPNWQPLESRNLEPGKLKIPKLFIYAKG